MPLYYVKNTQEGYQLVFRLNAHSRFIKKPVWNEEKKEIYFCFACFHFSRKPLFIAETSIHHISLKALTEIQSKTYETTLNLKEAFDQLAAIRDIATQAISETKNKYFYHNPHTNGQKPLDF